MATTIKAAKIALISKGANFTSKHTTKGLLHYLRPVSPLTFHFLLYIPAKCLSFWGGWHLAIHA